MNRPSYYDILGLATSANKEEIKSAFRKLAQKYHPDKDTTNQDKNSAFIVINTAYQTLTNESKKKEYDLYLHRFGNSKKTHFTPYKGHEPVIEKTLAEFNYVLWDIEEILKRTQEKDISNQIEGRSIYNHILYFFRELEESILKETYRFENFGRKKREKLHLENYFYLLRIEIEKHIDRMKTEDIDNEIEELINIKEKMMTFVSYMNKDFQETKK